MQTKTANHMHRFTYVEKAVYFFSIRNRPTYKQWNTL